MELTETEKELLEMLDELFEFPTQGEAYLQLLLIKKQIQLENLKTEVQELREKKINSLENQGISLN